MYFDVEAIEDEIIRFRVLIRKFHADFFFGLMMEGGF
jgi:hypothetical protein